MKSVDKKGVRGTMFASMVGNIKGEMSVRGNGLHFQEKVLNLTILQLNDCLNGDFTVSCYYVSCHGNYMVAGNKTSRR